MKILQSSIIVILLVSLIIDTGTVFAESGTNTSNHGNLPEANEANVQRGGFIQVLQQSNSISTDRVSYSYGDAISITGTYSQLYNNTILNYFVLNPDQEAISNHGFIAGSDGKFDALVVASGPKWNQSGTYIVILKSNQGIIAQNFFNFSGQEISTPEFGPMVSIILTTSIILIITISARTRLRC